MAEFTKAIIDLKGQVANIVVALDHYPKAPELIDAVNKINAFIENGSPAEIKCPFSPLRNGSGQRLIDDVAKLKTLVYVSIAFLAGLGILQGLTIAGLVK